MKKAALLGFGVVGSGVAELFARNAAAIENGAGEPMELKYILTRRDYPGSPFADKMVRDIGLIAGDPEVYVVAECIGGCGAAYDYVKRCLEAGKHVVTSNKELVAEKGLELLAIAKAKKVCFLFEASVGGGIPIIRPLTNCLSANRIDEVCGIVNGTTNYILTQMFQCGADFADALKEAQRLGYAEADPTADVEGIDACRKICILADLCFGKNVSPAWVETQGITGVTGADVAAAEALGYGIKLLGRAKRLPEGKVSAWVAPHLVSKSNLLSNVSGVMNGVTVRGDAVGDCLFYGAGAGKFPTASAVVADMIDSVRHEKGGKFIDWAAAEEDFFVPASALPSRWYIRRADGSTAITEPMLRTELEPAAAVFPVLD